MFLPRLLTSERRPSLPVSRSCSFKVDTSGTLTVTKLLSCHAVSRLVGDSSRVGFVTSLRGQKRRVSKRSWARIDCRSPQRSSSSSGRREKAARLLSAVSSRAAAWWALSCQSSRTSADQCDTHCNHLHLLTRPPALCLHSKPTTVGRSRERSTFRAVRVRASSSFFPVALFPGNERGCQNWAWAGWWKKGEECWPTICLLMEPRILTQCQELIWITFNPK